MEAFLRKLDLLELDGYQFERCLFGGQMATVAVYNRVSSIPAGKSERDAPARIAVKFLIAPRRDIELETFRREAETLLMLGKFGNSPTIVRALSNVRGLKDLPVYYFFMEYVEGVTLKDLFEKEPLPWTLEQALDHLRRIAMAMIPAAASAQVHRDLHPGNIMFAQPTAAAVHPLISEDPGVRILDFGVGRNWLTDQRENWQEDRFRHPGGISSWSPELLTDPSVVDCKHDIWALGNLFYRMLTGEHAFYSDHFRHYFDKVLAGSYDKEPLQPLPAHIKRLVKSMFETQPSRRISLGGVLKITSDILDRNLVTWLAAHPALSELYFLVEGNIWTCPLCAKTSNPTTDSRCRSCGRYVEEFLLPF